MSQATKILTHLLAQRTKTAADASGVDWGAALAAQEKNLKADTRIPLMGPPGQTSPNVKANVKIHGIEKAQLPPASPAIPADLAGHPDQLAAAGAKKLPGQIAGGIDKVKGIADQITKSPAAQQYRGAQGIKADLDGGVAKVKEMAGKVKASPAGQQYQSARGVESLKGSLESGIAKLKGMGEKVKASPAGQQYLAAQQPAPEPGWGDKALKWMGDNKGTMAGIGAGVGAAGLLAYILANRNDEDEDEGQLKAAGTIGNIAGGIASGAKAVWGAGVGASKAVWGAGVGAGKAVGRGIGKTVATPGRAAATTAGTIGSGVLTYAGATDKFNPIDSVVAGAKASGNALVGNVPEPTLADQATELGGQAVDKVKEWGGQAMDWAKNNQPAAIGLGVGAAGLLAYMLTQRRSRRRSRHDDD